VVFGLHGAGTGALLQTIFGALPQRINGTVTTDAGLLLQRDEAGNWFECWLPIANAATFWQRCRMHCDAAGSEYWRRLTIDAELGEVSAATAELFIPQMLNYHLNGAVSFKKGCYTGQEIVARTHYRGQVKRHLQRATGTGAAPAAGSEVSDANGRAIGNVVDSVLADGGQVETLVVINDAELATGTIKLVTGDAVLRVAPAPGQ
jgi:tRNA-modifying protein YgfZ